MFFEVPQPIKAVESPPDTIPDDIAWSNTKKRKIKDNEDSALPPRTPKACDRCRVKKTRCLADLDGTACKKCKREGAICTFAQESKPETKARSSPAYVQMLEGERRMLIQALRELSAAKGDITALDPGLRAAIEKMQLHNIVQSTDLRAIPEVYGSTHDESNHIESSSSSTCAPWQEKSTPEPVTTSGFMVPTLYDTSSSGVPQFVLTQEEMAGFANLDFQDYPINEWFGLVENSYATGLPD